MSPISTTSKAAVAIGAVLAALVIAFVVSVLLALPIKWLWNWLIPSIFGLRTISVLEAWGLSMLVKLIWPGSTKTDVEKQAK